MGPLVTAEHRDKVRCYVDLGVEEGAELVVDGRDFKLEGFQGYENGYYLGGCLFDRVDAADADLPGRDLRPGAVGRARARLRGRGRAGQRARVRQRHRDLHPRRRRRAHLRRTASRSAWSASTCRSRCRWRSTASAAGSARCSATTTCTAPRACASTPSQKAVTSRWPTGIRAGAEFKMPTMG